MTKKPKLERVEVGGLLFDVRPGTSDIKAINEVVKRRGYARRNFVPEPGEHWIDLGGHIGAFSVWAGSHGATATAYEADPEACELLERNARLNGMSRRVKVVNAAVVADRRKTATLHRNVARGNTWRNSIERGWRGEDTIEVPTLHVKKIWDSDLPGVKIDVEGSEMPILEWLIKTEHFTMPLKLVFEWTFDVDPSLARFEAVIAALHEEYDTVRYAGYQPGYDTWQASWFPPCRIVWCQ